MIHNPLLCYESRARQHLNDTILTVFQNPLNIKYDIYTYLFKITYSILKKALVQRLYMYFYFLE